MSPKAEIFVTAQNGEFNVRVTGRATFIVSVGLQEQIKKLVPGSLKRVRIDLAQCTGMDSTFMGILTELAMSAISDGIRAEITNAGEGNEALLAGLGVTKLFDFKAGEQPAVLAHTDVTHAPGTDKEQAQMVLNAHETLVKADEENAERFSGVIDMVKEELKNIADSEADSRG